MPKQLFEQTRLYPVILHREGGVWGYVSPEFGGGGAPSQADALAEAQALLQSAVADLYAEGAEIPAPTPAEDIDADGGIVTFMPVVLSNAAERLQITLPAALVVKMDAVTGNRSRFIAELVQERLG